MKKRIKNKRGKSSSLYLSAGIIMGIYTFIIIFLILWAVISSLKTSGYGLANVFNENEFGLLEGWPWEWNWSNYTKVADFLYVRRSVVSTARMVEVQFGGMLVNTLIYAVGGAIVMTLVPCFVAYATSVTNYKFNKILDTIVIVTMVVPIVGGYPSMLQILNDLGIYDTWIGFFVHHFHFLSIYYLVFQASFRSLPIAIRESASLDGANEYAIMFKIMVPLVKNLILTVMLIYFIQLWNDYQYPLLYLFTKPTLAYGIYYLVFENLETGVTEPMKFAGSIILFAPIVILFICFRDKLMQNLSMGGVKE